MVRPLYYLCIPYQCQLLSHVQLCVTPWTVARQVPLSMEFSSQEYWSGQPFPTPGDLPDPGIKPTCLVAPALADGLFTTAPPEKHPPPNGTNVKSLVNRFNSAPCFQSHLCRSLANNLRQMYLLPHQQKEIINFTGVLLGLNYVIKCLGGINKELEHAHSTVYRTDTQRGPTV